jgi:hypothetical protein
MTDSNGFDSETIKAMRIVAGTLFGIIILSAVFICFPSGPSFSTIGIEGCFDTLYAPQKYSLLPYCQVKGNSPHNFNGNMEIWPEFDTITGNGCFSGGVEWKTGTHFRLGGIISFVAFRRRLDSISIAVIDSSGTVHAFCRSITNCNSEICNLGKIPYY